MTCIQGLADAGEDFRYDLGLLNGLHFMIQEHHPEKRPGRLRKGPVHITDPDDNAVFDYTGPHRDEVPELMAELVTWLNEGDLDAPVHVRASMAHLNLVRIHLWADGNGRTSRSLATLVFSREALMPPEFSSIEEWLGQRQNTYRYYDILKEVGGQVWSPERDAGPWVKFALRAHHMQGQQAKRRVELSSRAWMRLGEEIAGQDLDERVLMALLSAFWGTKVRRTVYRANAELSDQQAVRDVKKLVALKWLDPHGQARGRYYTAGERMRRCSSTSASRQPPAPTRTHADPGRVTGSGGSEATRKSPGLPPVPGGVVEAARRRTGMRLCPGAGAGAFPRGVG
ncbi:Fic family protein [Streptomyces fructofermentans]|uniref:Fic family protein n=1 Tax=Streptomyces fructofermentans TaxID=152141 RepID=UPI0033C1F955